MFKLSVFFFFCLLAGGLAAFSSTSLSKTNHFVKTPATVSDKFIHVGGRYDERRLNYIASSGYSSFVSIVNYATNDTMHNDVPGSYPSTEYELKMMTNAGLKTASYVSSFTVESAEAIHNILESLPSPIIMHCHVSSLPFFSSYSLFLSLLLNISKIKNIYI